ncbi:YbgC/YbaW family acyl-CoA thioester hydrolase [Promicromonospora sp. AC04]|uniref:acyl-CoA thioesterase n=1 Tax=Promicromonospora sp. AC04 TaxID=2135723 RepID=UPI000D36DA4D|nr:acyl-CoA thioesterase [Promicromonospora sp. AC04]PUB24919.1 YbgC/YbaW family acyl-CoA thioester hydrolase [Promicromonospora sp. AC04]
MNLYFRLMMLRWRVRSRRRLELSETARTPFRVLPTDLDLLGHMNNGKYLSIMDVGRMDLLIRSGFWDVLRKMGWYPVVAGQTITYRRSLRLGQRFDLYTRLIGLDDRWGYVEQTICIGPTVYAQAVIRTRFLKQSGGSVEHDELRDALGDDPVAQLLVPEPVRHWTESLRGTGTEYVPANKDA